VFLQKIQDNLVRKDDREIPAVQKQPGQPDLEAVLRRVAQVYG
jgi:hypothetical protein